MNEVATFGKRLRQARVLAGFKNREAACEKLPIGSRTLDDIENDLNIPGSDVIAWMGKTYRDPTLGRMYCSEICPLGKGKPLAIEVGNLSTSVLGLMKVQHEFEQLRDIMISIAADGKVTPDEYQQFGLVRRKLNEFRREIDGFELWAEMMELRTKEKPLLQLELQEAAFGM